MKPHNLFIVFEGGDGSGKTSQAKALYKRLQKKYPVIYTQEPGGTFLGQVLRRWLTLPSGELPARPPENLQIPFVEPAIGDELLPDIAMQSTAPRAELLLFLIARAQLVDEVIRPNLEAGKVVICDRYAPSSVAYQGYGRGLALDLIEMANQIATQGLKPDFIALLDLPPERGLARKWTATDHFEEEQLSFHHRVREGYLKMAAADPDRWLVIDAMLPKGKIAEIIWEKLSQLLPNL